MKNTIERGWQWGCKLYFLLALLVPVSVGVSAAPTAAVATCTSPSVSVTGKTSSSISFAWGAVGSSYRVWYVRKLDGYTSSVTSTTSTSMTISGLSAGAYSFFFATVCDGLESDYAIVEDLILS